ncbi:MAG: FAD-binding oxidoreductase [Candidatus Omnitrophica bacterium]|nr:FAD-binding oxidoreductase [Candidatus Omnitrophota bacterium]
MKKKILIIGQGLAGSFLAWNLLEEGHSILIVDDRHTHCSSLAAAGMVNPITGKRLVLSQRCDELLPFAKNVYQRFETRFNRKFFESKKIIRLFRDAQELSEWDKKSQQPHLTKYYGEKKKAGTWGSLINDQLGSFFIEQGGYCRKLDLLNCLTHYFHETGCLRFQTFHYDNLKILDDHVRWNNQDFSQIIFCEGYLAQNNPWFKWLPFNHAKGEILELTTRNPLPDAVISCGKWCVPFGKNKYMVGSTYSWDHFDCQTSQAGRQKILDAIGEFIHVDFEVVHQLAGVRPILKDLNPALGQHPEYPHVKIFNGLASKGLIWGPFYARQMTDYLINNIPLDAQVNITRFTK